MDRSFIETVEDTNETTEYEELQQQLNYYFSESAIARWFTENLPEKEWLEEIAIAFVHELEGNADTDTDGDMVPSETVLCTYDEVNDFIWGRVKDIIREENLPFPEVDAVKITNELQSALELKEENKKLKARIEELENDEMTQADYTEWNRENPEIQALGRQIESLEQTSDSLRAERAKLIAYIKEQQEHIRVLGAQYEADNGQLATADWDSILRSDDTSSGEEKAATQQTEEHK